ncbi:MAG: 3'-5' exonuclease, partial [Marivivens sp.]|nr:3'-5' exonuclease [Marivivens sp.]
MRLTHAADESDVTPGYVMSIDDVTHDLAVVGQSTTLLTRVFADLRPHMASLRTAIEFRKRDTAFADDPDMTDGLIDGLEIMLNRIGTHFAEYDSSRGSLWPMEDVSARQIVNAVKSRLDDTDLTVEGLDATRLHVAALPMIVLLAHLCDRIVKQHGGRVPSLIVADEEDCPMIALGWSGEPLPFDTMSHWLSEPLDFGVPGMSGHSVLRLHATDCWPEFGRFGRSVLKIPLPQQSGRILPALQRGVEYDFDLMQKTPPAQLTKARLSDLTFVVFDTETTGLLPSQGDEICQIAALRVVNGRIVEGEQINRLVNPERSIPARSTDVHGITDEMVANAPNIDVVGSQFHSFA